MISRQPKIHAGLRIVAAGCIVLWSLAASRCSIEHLCCCDRHDAEAAEHAHDSEEPSHDSHHHDGGENSCCSTLVATAQIAQPFIFAKPILLLNFPCTFLPVHNPMLAAPENMPECQANRRDWVFTPEVCLGPAHSSLAPPSLA